MLQNGVVRVTVSDSNLSGGVPGILALRCVRCGRVVRRKCGVRLACMMYSVGGTVSGLSGTVVLQDNGADQLSVSASGSFTFATQLASGAAYNVTVQANPSGVLARCLTARARSARRTSPTSRSARAASGGGGGGGGGAGETVIGSDGFNRANGSLGCGLDR